MRKHLIGPSALLAALAFSLLSYSDLPSQVPIHWDLQFNVDGYASRLFAAVIIPIAFLIMPLLAWGLPKIDPKKSLERHAHAWWVVWTVNMVVVAIAQTLIIASARGWPIDMAMTIPILVGASLLLIGNYLPQVRPNWFLGVRTPWTLSDEDVWRRTHRFAGRTMSAGGLLLLLAAFVDETALRSVIVVAALTFAVVPPVLYSLMVWRRTDRAPRPADA